MRTKKVSRELGAIQTAMYYSWLDRWDERRAQLGNEVKKIAEFVLASELAFPNAKNAEDIAEFCDLADQALADPTFFDERNGFDVGFEKFDEWIKFPSSISTDVEENDVVCAKVTESGSLDKALVVFTIGMQPPGTVCLLVLCRVAASQSSRLHCPII